MLNANTTFSGSIPETGQQVRYDSAYRSSLNEENQYREMILDTDSHGPTTKTMLNKQAVHVTATVRNLRNRTTIGDMPTTIHLRNKSPSGGIFDTSGSRILGQGSPSKAKKLQLNIASGQTSGHFVLDNNGPNTASNTARKLSTIASNRNTN